MKPSYLYNAKKYVKFPRNFICEKPSKADIHCTCKVKNSTFQLFCTSATPLCLRWDPFRSKFIPWSWREGKDAINIPCANIYSGKAHTCKGLKLSCNKYQNPTQSRTNAIAPLPLTQIGTLGHFFRADLPNHRFVLFAGLLSPAINPLHTFTLSGRIDLPYVHMCIYA